MLNVEWALRSAWFLHTDPTDLTDFYSFGVFPLRGQMRIPVACNEEDPWDL